MGVKIVQRGKDHPNSYTVYAIFSANRAAEIQVNLGLKTGQTAGITTVMGPTTPLTKREMGILMKAQEIATEILTGELAVIGAKDWEFKPTTR